MKRNLLCLAAAACAAAALAQDDARSAYQMRQAVQEVQRLSSQFDQMQNGMESLTVRMRKLEGANASGDLRAEIGALRSELNSKKMADLIAKNRPAPPPPPPASTRGGKGSHTAAPPPEAAPSGPTGPYFEHIVEPGETLSYIAKECNTTVHKIKQYSGLRSDVLRVGQKLLIPAEDEDKGKKKK